MSERLTPEWIAETLLLAMDGDYLPGAGMSIGNTGEDVPLRHARPKEVAWWAAEAITTALDLEETDECHCGRPVSFGYDGNPHNHRGMCDECDARRCDAYPLACPYRGEIR